MQSTQLKEQTDFELCPKFEKMFDINLVIFIKKKAQ